MTLVEAVNRVISGKSLSRVEARAAMSALMSGEATPVQMAAYLAGLRTKGETVDELAGSADAMRAVGVRVRTTAKLVVDTCGTGGDGQNLFNVSTVAAFVVAGAGFTVAKHGNRAISSRSGSADLVLALGLPIEVSPAIIETCLNEIGIAFLFAPVFHPAMRHAMPVRKELAVRTIFNLLGPLTNPAGAHVQLIGVYEAAWVRPLAETLAELGARNGVVVHGQGTDEIALSGPTQVAEIVNGAVVEATWVPEHFGVNTRSHEALQGGSPERNAEIAREVLAGKNADAQAMVCMNAAALIRAASRESPMRKKNLTLEEAYGVALESIRSGAAAEKYEALKAHLAGVTKP